MPLPVILGAAKGALAIAKAAKAAKALKAAKSMKAAGTAAKGAKATKGASAAKKARLQRGADRLVKRNQRRTEMKKNMEARAKQQEQQSSGESKKKKESIQELYDKSREGLERKDRRSAAMSNFATKGTMKHGGKYEHGGRKPLKKLKGAIQKANHKAGAVKNRLEKKVLEAVKRKKDMKKMPGGGKMDMKKMPGGGKMKLYKKGGKKFPDLNKDGKITMADILQGRGVKPKAEKGMKYKHGGKLDGVTSVTKGGRRVTEVNTSGEGLERSVTTRKKNMKRGVKAKSKIVKQSSAGGNTITKKKMRDGEVIKSKTRSVSDKAAARAAKKIENIARKSRGLK